MILSFIGKRLACWCVLLSLTGGTCQAVCAQPSRAQSLVNKLPSGANMIMLINVEQIRNTPVVGSEAWERTFENSYSPGMERMLQNAGLVVVAANVSQQRMLPVWRAALMEEKDGKRFDRLSSGFSGNLDRHLGFDFIEMENDTYMLMPEPGLVGVFSPGERQYFSHWLGDLRKPKPLKNDYLENAVRQFDAGDVQMVMAADLRFAYSPVRILDEVRDSEILAEHGIDPRSFAKLGASIEGFTIRTTMGEEIAGSIELSFSKDISGLGPVARDLAFEFLDDSGIEIPEMARWDLEAGSQKIRLAGPLSPEGFQLMVSQMDLIQDAPAWTQYESGTADPGRISSEYFRTVDGLIRELKRQQRAHINFASNANTMERYARRIRKLPTAFVDQEVVDFADRAVSLLYEATTQLRNSGEKTKTDKAGLRSSRGSSDFGIIAMSGSTRRHRFGRFGRASRGTGKYERQEAAQKNAESAYLEINQQFEDLAKESLELQRWLEEKYGVEF